MLTEKEINDIWLQQYTALTNGTVATKYTEMSTKDWNNAKEFFIMGLEIGIANMLKLNHVD